MNVSEVIRTRDCGLVDCGRTIENPAESQSVCYTCLGRWW